MSGAVGQFMEKRGAVFFRRYDEQIAQRHRNAIGHAAVESLRSCVLNVGRVRHCGDDPFGRFDRVVFVRLDLREFVEHGLGQFALFEIKHAKISAQESSARLRVCRLVVEVFRALLRVFNLPENDDRTFLALAEVSAQSLA